MKKIMLMTALAVAVLAGCQSADPASRSNSTRYRDIYVSNASNVTLTVGDGLYADSSGGGDTQSNTPTQTLDTKPEVAVALPGGTAGTGGAKPQSGIVGEALDALGRILKGSGEKLTPEQADAIKECADVNCE